MNKQEIIDYIKNNPTTSIRNTAKELHTHPTSIARIKKTLDLPKMPDCNSCRKKAPPAPNIIKCTKFHINKDFIDDLMSAVDDIINYPSNKGIVNNSRQHILNTLEGAL
jgi:hypothetical protein